jgi:hypothetical protein
MQPSLETNHWHNSAGLADHLQAARLSAKARLASGSPALLIAIVQRSNVHLA